MPIIKSAKKRVKIAAKAHARNLVTKRTFRDALKAYSKALATGKPSEITKAYGEVISAIDTAAKKNVIHKNRASRMKSKAASQAKASGHKLQAKTAKPKAKTPAKKPAAKKPAAKPKSSKSAR